MNKMKESSSLSDNDSINSNSELGDHPKQPKKRRRSKKSCIAIRRKCTRIVTDSIQPDTLPLLSDSNSSLDGPSSSFPSTPTSCYPAPNIISTQDSSKEQSSIVPFVPSPSSLGPKQKKLNYEEQKNMRIAIAFLFERVYYDTYVPEMLHQIVKSICNTFNISSHCTVKRVIVNKKQSLDSSIGYHGNRKKYEKEQKWKIIQGSFEEHLISVWIERGSSFKTATKVYNAKFRSEFNLPRVGVTAISNAMKRAKHITESTTSIPQTNQDNIIHKQARYNWICQLLVRMGEKIPSVQNEEDSDFRKRLDDNMVNRERLEDENLTFVPEQVAYWDEIHIYQVVGTNRKKHMIFARDENGIYKKDGGFEHANKKVSYLYIV